MTDDTSSGHNHGLRLRAEASMSGAVPGTFDDVSSLSHEEILKLYHELRVNQIELEMQNEDLHKTQAQLHLARENYFDLYDNAPIAYCTISESGLIVEANLAAAIMFATPRGLFIEQPFSRYIAESNEDVYYLYRKKLFTENTAQSCDLQMERSDGSTFWAHMTTTLARTPEGFPLCRAVISDITSRKNAEDERRRMDARVMQIQKLEALGLLVAGVAHNINNMLAAIMATVSVRESSVAPGEDADAYRIIERACMRGREVLISLVQFARPSLNQNVPFDLCAVIQEVVNLLKGTTAGRNIDIRSSLDESLWICGDASDINLALMNLCMNALDAMPERGTLTISARTVDGVDHGTLVSTAGFAAVEPQVEVSVADTGCGMTPEILSHAMDPFFTTKQIGKSTGLGLSMTYGIVKAHGGMIHITSAPGVGTTIYLRFPRVPSPVQAVPKPVAKPATVQTKSILLVDDDEDVRFLVSWMLTKAGYDLRSVESGEDALASLEANPLPDIVIMDQNMVGMSGIKTMERIHALYPGLPVLISSGQLEIRDLPVFGQPLSGFIPKPFNLAEMEAAIHRLEAG